MAHAQEIVVEANNQALSKILVDIRDEYNLDISFNDRELAKYIISVQQNFSTPQKAFSYLIDGLPITVNKNDNVYLFLPKKESLRENRTFILSGKIVDSENGESLPYTNISINGIGQISDIQGRFNATSKSDSIFLITLNYLGYETYDTIINSGLHYVFELKPANVNIQEILVHSNPYSTQVGSQAGLMRINHKVALLIPGNGDNSVFNILRLQPGIMAAGDLSNDLIIWGSYAGQSQVNFDGMTLFGLKNYNDNISAVNPYMAKDIRIHKGGYDASLGERVGGIIEISGIDGDKENYGANLNLNNLTMNLMAHAPLKNNLTLVGAFRQTYYNLYTPDDVSYTPSDQMYYGSNTIITQPKYTFRDGNLKLSGETKQHDTYYISSFLGQDRFAYSVNQSHANVLIEQNYEEKNRQHGISANYSKLWEGMGHTSFKVAYSGLESYKTDVQNSSQMMMNHNMHRKDETWINQINELKVNIEGLYNLTANNTLEYGTGLINNLSLLTTTEATNSEISELEKGNQFMFFLQDKINISSKLRLTGGIRADYSLEIKQIYWQPRINFTYQPFTNFKLNAAWGLYNQFVVYDAEIDQYYNYRFRWIVANGTDIPVLNSQHLILGGQYLLNGFIFSAEGYVKKTTDISRLVQKNGVYNRYSGNSKTRGLDIFIKKNLNQHSFWVSYSLSQSLEWFPYFKSTEYQRAFIDQTHELKMAGIANFSPFIFSANYVLGSGYFQNLSSQNKSYPYNRIDISGLYRFKWKRMNLETGFSILNLLNTKNIKYTNITQIPAEGSDVVSIYSAAVPFSPSVFINITF